MNRLIHAFLFDITLVIIPAQNNAMERITRVFEHKNTREQCRLTAFWLDSDADTQKKNFVMQLFLKKHKLSSNQKLNSAHYLAHNEEKTRFFAHIIASILSKESLRGARFPLQPLFKALNDGSHDASQKTLRRKLYAHSDLDPEQIDILVFYFEQALARANLVH
jgi:hypothetical protein